MGISSSYTREQFNRLSEGEKYDTYRFFREKYSELFYDYDKLSETKKELNEEIKSLKEEIDKLSREVRYKDSPPIDIMVKLIRYSTKCSPCPAETKPESEVDCYHCENTVEIVCNEHYLCRHFDILDKEAKNGAVIGIVDDNFNCINLCNVLEVFDMSHGIYLYGRR